MADNDLFTVEKEELDNVFPTIDIQNNPYSSEYTSDRALYSSIAIEPLDGNEAFESIYNRNRELIENGKEHVIEAQASNQRKQRELDANTSIQRDLLYTPNSSELINMFEENRVDLESREERSAIEKEAIQKFQDLMVEDPYQAAIYVNRINQGDLLDRQRDQAIKLAIYQRELDKLRVDAEYQGIAGKAADFVFGIVDLPLASIGEILNFEESASGNRGFFALPSTKVNRQATSLWDPNVSVDEFDEMVTKAARVVKNNSGVLIDNENAALESFANLRGLNNTDALTYNTFTALDVASVPGAGLAVKAISTPTRIAKAIGNRSAAVRGIVRGIYSPSEDVAVNATAARESFPSSLVPDTPEWSDPSIGLHGDVADKLSVLRTIKNEALNITTPERATPEQYAAEVTKKVDDLTERFKDENIVDTKSNIDPDTRIRSVSLYLGRKTGDGGYLSEAAAKGAAVRRGFSLEDVEIHHGIDDRHYIKVTENVAENGIVSPALKEADFPTTGKAGSWLKNPDNVVAQMFSEPRHLSEGAKSLLSGQVIRPLVKYVKKLKGKEIEDMNSVMAVGEREEKWFNPQELHFQYERMRGTPPSDKEILAYYATKELNDFDYMVRNREVYIKRARMGYETINISDGQQFVTGRRNAIVLSSNEVRGKRIFDLEDKRGYAPDTNNDYFIEKLESGNYNLVRLESTFDYSREPIKYILAHKQSMTRGPLDLTQLGYRAGGHRLYRDKWFVKQARRIEFKDGDEAWSNPLTHIVAKTEKQAKKWAQEMERARIAYRMAIRGEIDMNVAQTIVSESTEMSLEKFGKLVKEGKIDLEHPFETLYDKTNPTAMTGVGENRLWVDEFSDGTDQWYNTSGRMYYSAKGEHLKNPFDEYAEILDPFDSIQKSVVNALGTRAMSDYQTFAMEEWARVASPYIKKGSFTENPSKHRLFFDGQFDEDFIRNKPEFHAALETNRTTIKRFAGYQTQEMHGLEMASRRISAWLESEKPGVQKYIPESARDWASAKSMDIMDSNPINAVRGIIFDTQLGFFDPGQFFLQTQTAFATMALDPKNGPGAAAMWPFIRLVGTNRSPQVLDYVATRAKAIHGLEPEEFKDMINTMMKTGEYDIGGSIIELGHWNNKVGGNAVVRGFDDLRNAGRFIFNEAETLNRTVAWQLAWKNTRAKLPNVPTDSVEFIQAVKLSAADYGMNMRGASAAAWQKGILSVPTQFMSYQARLLENMLPKMFGGNPRFSGAQKFRLALSQGLLYGAAGLPVFNYAADQWKKHRGDDLSPEAWRVVTKGFWDTMFYTLSGGELDTDFADRAGVGAGWEETINKLVDGDNNSFLSVMAGPTGTIGGDLFESFERIALYGRAGLDGGALSKEAFHLIAADLAANVNSLDRASKAAIIWRMGKVIDRKTGKPIVDATELEGFAALLGIPLREEREIYELMDEVYNREQEVKEVAKLIAKINDDFFRAMERGDTDGMKSAERLRAGIIQSYGDDPLKQQQIAKQALTIQSYTQDRMNYARQQYQERLGKTVPTEEQ